MIIPSLNIQNQTRITFLQHNCEFYYGFYGNLSLDKFQINVSKNFFLKKFYVLTYLKIFNNYKKLLKLNSISIFNKNFYKLNTVKKKISIKNIFFLKKNVVSNFLKKNNYRTNDLYKKLQYTSINSNGSLFYQKRSNSINYFNKLFFNKILNTISMFSVTSLLKCKKLSKFLKVKYDMLKFKKLLTYKHLSKLNFLKLQSSKNYNFKTYKRMLQNLNIQNVKYAIGINNFKLSYANLSSTFNFTNKTNSHIIKILNKFIGTNTALVYSLGECENSNISSFYNFSQLSNYTCIKTAQPFNTFLIKKYNKLLLKYIDVTSLSYNKFKIYEYTKCANLPVIFNLQKKKISVNMLKFKKKHSILKIFSKFNFIQKLRSDVFSYKETLSGSLRMSRGVYNSLFLKFRNAYLCLQIKLLNNNFNLIKLNRLVNTTVISTKLLNLNSIWKKTKFNTVKFATQLRKKINKSFVLSLSKNFKKSTKFNKLYKKFMNLNKSYLIIRKKIEKLIKKSTKVKFYKQKAYFKNSGKVEVKQNKFQKRNFKACGMRWYNWKKETNLNKLNNITTFKKFKNQSLISFNKLLKCIINLNFFSLSTSILLKLKKIVSSHYLNIDVFINTLSTFITSMDSVDYAYRNKIILMKKKKLFKLILSDIYRKYNFFKKITSSKLLKLFLFLSSSVSGNFYSHRNYNLKLAYLNANPRIWDNFNVLNKIKQRNKILSNDLLIFCKNKKIKLTNVKVFLKLKFKYIKLVISTIVKKKKLFIKKCKVEMLKSRNFNKYGLTFKKYKYGKLLHPKFLYFFKSIFGYSARYNYSDKIYQYFAITQKGKFNNFKHRKLKSMILDAGLNFKHAASSFFEKSKFSKDLTSLSNSKAVIRARTSKNHFSIKDYLETKISKTNLCNSNIVFCKNNIIDFFYKKEVNFNHESNFNFFYKKLVNMHYSNKLICLNTYNISDSKKVLLANFFSTQMFTNCINSINGNFEKYIFNNFYKTNFLEFYFNKLSHKNKLITKLVHNGKISFSWLLKHLNQYKKLKTLVIKSVKFKKSLKKLKHLIVWCKLYNKLSTSSIFYRKWDFVSSKWKSLVLFKQYVNSYIYKNNNFTGVELFEGINQTLKKSFKLGKKLTLMRMLVPVQPKVTKSIILKTTAVTKFVYMHNEAENKPIIKKSVSLNSFYKFFYQSISFNKLKRLVNYVSKFSQSTDIFFLNKLLNYVSPLNLLSTNVYFKKRLMFWFKSMSNKVHKLGNINSKWKNIFYKKIKISILNRKISKLKFSNDFNLFDFKNLKKFKLKKFIKFYKNLKTNKASTALFKNNNIELFNNNFEFKKNSKLWNVSKSFKKIYKEFDNNLFSPYNQPNSEAFLRKFYKILLKSQYRFNLSKGFLRILKLFFFLKKKNTYSIFNKNKFNENKLNVYITKSTIKSILCKFKAAPSFTLYKNKLSTITKYFKFFYYSNYKNYFFKNSLIKLQQNCIYKFNKSINLYKNLVPMCFKQYSNYNTKLFKKTINFFKHKYCYINKLKSSVKSKGFLIPKSDEKKWYKLTKNLQKKHFYKYTSGRVNLVRFKTIKKSYLISTKLFSSLKKYKLLNVFLQKLLYENYCGFLVLLTKSLLVATFKQFKQSGLISEKCYSESVCDNKFLLKTTNSSNLFSTALLSLNGGIFKSNYGKVKKSFMFKINLISDLISFKSKLFNLIIRSNPCKELLLRSLLYISKLFKGFKFLKNNLIKFIFYFNNLVLTKDVVHFTYFMDFLIKNLTRVEQKNFFIRLRNFSVQTISKLFSLYGIVGLYMSASGKIGGYAGDRTKLFPVRFGFCSKSKKIYKYNFFQKSINSRPGSINFKILILFK